MPDVVELLEQDHRDVEALFAQIQPLLAVTDEDSIRRRHQLVEQVIRELVTHSVAEEAIVYPRVAEKVGPDEADRLRKEQAEAEVTMKQLERLDPADADYVTSLTGLMEAIKAHVQEEEGTAFPRLRQVLDTKELEDLATHVDGVKKLAPTHPHPAAPDTPPANILLGPVVGLFDRLRDAVAGR